MIYQESNREKVKNSRKRKGYWCYSCDQCIVQDGQKCRVCGHIAGGHKTSYKKPAPKE
jgi:hypothetical protein